MQAPLVEKCPEVSDVVPPVYTPREMKEIVEYRAKYRFGPRCFKHREGLRCLQLKLFDLSQVLIVSNDTFVSDVHIAFHEHRHEVEQAI